MRFNADLHIHSKYSRATSPRMNIQDLSEAAKVKGVNLLGTGDFTHPQHFADLKRDLKDAGNGFYKYNDTYFLLSAEISNIFTQGGRGRKIHHVILAPSLEVVEQLNEGFLKWGRLDYDGRPIFGRTGQELLDLTGSISKDIEVIPAHAWTPWFSVFGSNSGFDSLEECYGEKAKRIHAIETGLSSDPAMNWRLSALDRISLVSFSDSHSPYPWRLGRELTAFELEKPSYFELVNALREKDKKKLLFTLEFFPEEGKYHYDGHRACNVVLSPEEARKVNNICPVCRKQLTIGVAHRVEELADRPVGFKPKGAIPFKSLIPLSELIAGVCGTAPDSKRVWEAFYPLLNRFGSELNVLLEASSSEIVKVSNKKIADVIIRNRNGEIPFKPGYDGVYGEPIFNENESVSEAPKPSRSQKSLSDY